MANWGSGYQHEESNRLDEGAYRVEIVSVEEGNSKAGNPMLTLGIRPNGSTITIKHYIVKNDYFNRNMTQLFESFNIEEGDFNLMTWVGATGAAQLKKDDRGYLKVAWFIREKKADETLPPWEGTMPERQTVSRGFEEVEDDEDLPF
jgi:hypothetical protein